MSQEPHSPQHRISTTENAEHEWEPIAPDRYRCTGAAIALGFDATAVLDFCRGGVCGVTLIYRPQSGWAEAVTQLKATLENKYGAALERVVIARPDCSSDATFISCIDDGRVRIKYSWAWPTRERMELKVTKPEPADDGETKAAIRLTYTKPNSIDRPNAAAL